MIRKIFKTGNSLVVSLPREMLAPLGLTDGSEVLVETSYSNSEIVIRPVRPQLAPGINEEFVRQVNEFVAEYRTTLEALARR